MRVSLSANSKRRSYPPVDETRTIEIERPAAMSLEVSARLVTRISFPAASHRKPHLNAFSSLFRLIASDVSSINLIFQCVNVMQAHASDAGMS